MDAITEKLINRAKKLGDPTLFLIINVNICVDETSWRVLEQNHTEIYYPSKSPMSTVIAKSKLEVF